GFLPAPVGVKPPRPFLRSRHCTLPWPVPAGWVRFPGLSREHPASTALRINLCSSLETAVKPCCSSAATPRPLRTVGKRGASAWLAAQHAPCWVSRYTLLLKGLRAIALAPCGREQGQNGAVRAVWHKKCDLSPLIGRFSSTPAGPPELEWSA